MRLMPQERLNMVLEAFIFARLVSPSRWADLPRFRVPLGILLLAAALLAALPALADCTPVKRVSIESAMDAVRNRCASEAAGVIGMCLGAIDLNQLFNGDAAWVKCYGLRSAFPPLALDGGTLFEIGSVTKAFTATVLAKRVVQGEVMLDWVVGDFISPEPAPTVDRQVREDLALEDIRLVDLADHHAGLPTNSPAGFGDHVTTITKAFLDCIQKKSCWSGVGTYAYSNFGFDILGNTLAAIDGFPEDLGWERDLRQSVLNELGMANTGIAERLPATNPSSWSTRACGFDAGGAQHCDLTPPLPSSPAGGLYSTPDDMLGWLGYTMGFHTGQDLEAARQLAEMPEATRNSNKQQIGLSWDIDKDSVLGVNVISKGGDWRDFHAHVRFTQDGVRGVFVLLNEDGAPSQKMIAEMLLDSLP
jgi:serine-type D-Ala-D-Ala carboxypeptidase/endopeptidase